MRALFNIAIGLMVLLGGGALSIAWIFLCFATVVVGLLLLYLAPGILFSPLLLSLALGVAMVRESCAELKSKWWRLVVEIFRCLTCWLWPADLGCTLKFS